MLAAAIHLGVTIRGERLAEPVFEVSSETNGRSFRTPLHRLVKSLDEAWSNYPVGVLDVLLQAGYHVRGARLQIESNLPLGAGLSSSAAIEVATALALSGLYELPIPPMRLAQLCQKAENEFVGVQCGLLDQASSVFGRDNQAILLDFRDLQVETVALPEGIALLLINSGVEHALTGGEYNERAQQCAAAAKALGVAALRDVSSEELQAANLDELVKRRALHITGENERVLAGREALRQQDVQRFGESMFASHQSSRDYFENSTPELDTLVEIARQLPGVYGSRLTGGGFGGSTVSLIAADHAPEIIQSIGQEYKKRTGVACSTILTRPAEGARFFPWDPPRSSVESAAVLS